MLGMSPVELLKTSPTMVVLLVCSIVTVGYAVERGLYFLRTRSDTAGFMRELAKRLQQGDPRAAAQWCHQQKGAAPRVVSQVLDYLDLPKSELMQRFNTAIELEQVEMERNLSVLGTMSNIAPLLGLLGTVIGIIRAFADIARTGAGGSAVVAMGVSEALLTTAAGIIVAVIATVCFNLFVRRIRTRIVELEDAREAFFGLLARVQAKTGRAVPQDASADVDQILDTAGEVAREPVTAGR